MTRFLLLKEDGVAYQGSPKMRDGCKFETHTTNNIFCYLDCRDGVVWQSYDTSLPQASRYNFFERSKVVCLRVYTKEQQ